MQSSRLWRFMRKHECATYPELCERAARDPDWFWDALIKELGIVWSRSYHAVMDTSSGLPFTRWFPGGLLNAYDSAVLRHRRSNPNGVAIIGETEAGTVRQLTYAQLEDAVEQTAAGLRAIGVKRGVAVGLYLPLVMHQARRYCRPPFLGLRRGSDPPAAGRRRRARADYRGRRCASRTAGRDEADR